MHFGLAQIKVAPIEQHDAEGELLTGCAVVCWGRCVIFQDQQNFSNVSLRRPINMFILGALQCMESPNQIVNPGHGVDTSRGVTSQRFETYFGIRKSKSVYDTLNLCLFGFHLNAMIL